MLLNTDDNRMNTIRPQTQRLRARLSRAAITAVWLLTGVMFGNLAAAENSPPSSEIADDKNAVSAGSSSTKMPQVAEGFVLIPGGSFQMGGKNKNDKPVHPVTLRSFAMSKYETTFAQYDAFAEATGRNTPSDSGWGRDDRPVINVNWEDATAYARWLSDQTGKTFRLPTEAEWEYAARAGSTTHYPWGNEVGRGRANCNGCGSQWDKNRSAPVGSFSANGWGLYDMAGNVAEWVQDCWHKNYQGAPADGQAWLETDCNDRVMRGGSWLYGATYMRSSFRFNRTASFSLYYGGFRLVQEP